MTRAPALNSPIATMTDPPPAQRPLLWRRLLLLFLLEIDVALGAVLLLRVRPGLPYLALILFDSTLLGLVCGFGTRCLLKERHWTLRSLAAMAALSIGLFTLGIASGWHYGLGPLVFNSFDLAGAFQMTSGLLASLLAATAFRKPVVQIQGSANIPPTQPQQPEKPVVRKSRRPTIHRKQKPVTYSRSRGRSKAAPRPALPKKAPEQKPPVILPAKKSRAKRRSPRPEVQFASTEEHRCPYCLEIVHENDPRGIVECKICHALHHADCWAITGTCQVPHLNS